MRKLKGTRSRFFGPIMNWIEDVYTVCPCTYAEFFGLDVEVVIQQCKEGILPNQWDGEMFLIPMDDRDVLLGGEGGKFTLPAPPYSEILLFKWRGRRAQ
jgi:hypothetical protein